MADRRTKKKAGPQEPAAPTEPEPGAGSEPVAGPEPGTASEPAAESEPAAGFENRAARRARKRGAQLPKATGKINPHGNRGPVQAQRSWANRRSG